MKKLTSKRKRVGLIREMYSIQKLTSERNHYPKPNYCVEELFDYIIDTVAFDILYKNWVDSDFKSELKPSIDRINDYLPYQLDNIRLTTWGINRNRGFFDRKNCINNKTNIPITGFNIRTKISVLFNSAREAERSLGIANQNIARCLNGKSFSAGGYTWEYYI